MVESSEHIIAHFFWIWGEEEGFLKRGKEGMLVITNRRLAFLVKTEMTFRMHDAHTQRQARRLKDGEDIFKPAEGYKLDHLEKDLDKSPDNLDFLFSEIYEISSEKKRWGTPLRIKTDIDGKQKSLRFSIVKGWVKYPAKEPMGYVHLDWTPIIKMVEAGTKTDNNMK